jgi:hypothetical protein
MDQVRALLGLWRDVWHSQYASLLWYSGFPERARQLSRGGFATRLLTDAQFGVEPDF